MLPSNTNQIHTHNFLTCTATTRLLIALADRVLTMPAGLKAAWLRVSCACIFCCWLVDGGL
jgi:hypothetical protein